MKRMIMGMILLFGAAMFLMGCTDSKTDMQAEADTETEMEEDGSRLEHTDSSAPKTINSTEILSFKCDFSVASYEENDTDYVGVVSVPTCLDRSRRIRIKPECEGVCKDICLFVVDIPKDCNDKKREVKVTHIYESQ